MNFDFLISSERSGSNLITKLLDNHSNYCGPTPPHLLKTFSDVMDGYGNLNEEDNWVRFIDDFHEFFYCKIGVWALNVSKEELLNVSPRNLEEVFRHLYQEEAKIHNKTRVFVKEVKTYGFFNFIKEKFPESKFIWLVRDPRDMALSWTKSPVHRGDIVRAAEIWRNDQKETIKFYEGNGSRILLVKYEDLITNQQYELRRICEFLAVDFEATMVEYHKNKISKENAVQTDNWKNLQKKIIKNNSRKYLQSLSEEQIRFIEYTCHEEMKFLVYDFEYALLQEYQYNQLYKDLKKMERHEKPEYQNIDSSEKFKRAKWYKKFLQIKSLKQDG
ncbi:sulfotransferase [Mangrovimonas sp. CR14]|uniref:sulfotransferase family protein n=1 Tax=Mangrovimonas sp. CR14 TaxID=2706120 RepID=UPI00141E8A31|nr:sulfotransferase [Mangrovimonas sp. CR14]NIK91373.1 sulfotransferase [Mangrovimonas sp. CR14]